MVLATWFLYSTIVCVALAMQAPFHNAEIFWTVEVSTSWDVSNTVTKTLENAPPSNLPRFSDLFQFMQGSNSFFLRLSLSTVRSVSHYVSCSFLMDCNIIVQEPIDFEKKWPSSYADGGQVGWSSTNSTDDNLRVSFPNIRHCKFNSIQLSRGNH